MKGEEIILTYVRHKAGRKKNGVELAIAIKNERGKGKAERRNWLEKVVQKLTLRYDPFKA